LNTKLISARLRLSPSGRVAVSWSRVDPKPSPPCQSCQTSAEVETGTVEESHDRHNPPPSSAKPGHGALGKKPSMSWRTGVQLRERMAACEMEYEKKNCWFLTLTIPGGDSASFEAVARYSSYAIDRINRSLNRYFDGEPFARCSVWEYQERGALHAHMLLASDCIHAKNIQEFRKKIIKTWYSTLQKVSQKNDCNPFADKQGDTRSIEDIMRIKNGETFVNCQVVKKSVVAYLSSYLSGSNHEKDSKNKQGLREKFFPIATWAQWNRMATRLFNKYSESIDLGECPDVDLPSIEAAFKSLEKSIPRVEGTDIKYPKNPYVNGFYAIIDRDVKGQKENLIEIVKDALCWIFDDRFKYERWLRDNRTRTREDKNDNPYKDWSAKRYNRWVKTKRLRFENEFKTACLFGEEVAFLGVFMLELMQEKGDILVSNPPKTYQQLEFNYVRT